MVKLKAKSGIMKKIYIKPSSEVFQVYMEKLMVSFIIPIIMKAATNIVSWLLSYIYIYLM